MIIGRAKEAVHYITPDQLCVGLHVHLDLPWTEHPFTFSSFKIRSPDQIEAIQALHLARIRYSPSKSDCEPQPAAPQSPRPAAQYMDSLAPAEAAANPEMAERRERMKQRLLDQRAKASACQKALQGAARTVRSINQNVFSQPAKVREEAAALIQSISDSMLVDADVSIQLMADKVGGEDVYFHSLNVSLLSMMLAKELKAPDHVIQMTGMAALFHDIGELEIPDRILRKQEPLTKAELALLHTHTDHGVQVARRMNLPAEVAQAIAQHHERVDGSGYPQGLKAAQMSLISRIVSLVNAYDELCTPPQPSRALTPHEALSTMFAQQRSQFDPLAMSTFVRCMGVYPPGTIVVLSNGMTAMVVSVNTTKPLRPVVLVHDPAVRKEDAVLVDLEAEQDVSINKTIRPQQLSEEAHAYLAPRRRMTYFFDAEVSKGGA